MGCHLCTDRTTKDQEQCLGGHPTKPSPVRFYFIYKNLLLSEAKKGIYPFQCLATNSIAKGFAFKEIMRGVSNAFSKSNMNVSTCPLLSKILAQSFITVVNWVSQLCPFWMHVAYLTGVYIHQDELWYLNILCVRVTCKVHKSRKLGDNSRKWPVTFLEKGADICNRPFLWDFTSVNWLLKKMSKYRT